MCGALLVDAVGEAPATAGVVVAVARVDEAVLQRAADVLGRQAGHRRHHLPGEQAQLQGPLVLAPPPEVLSPGGGEPDRRTDGKQLLVSADILSSFFYYFVKSF